jgi:hypothetical protein
MIICIEVVAYNGRIIKASWLFCEVSYVSGWQFGHRYH